MEQRKPIGDFANDMRLRPTRWEQAMYYALLSVFRPYRASVHAQEPIGPYIADFYIAPSNVVVEVDGGSHRTPEGKVHDQRRDTFMRGRGIRVFRLQNRQVNRSSVACAIYILNQCMPLEKQTAFVPVTYCPAGSALKSRTRGERNLFWKT